MSKLAVYELGLHTQNSITGRVYSLKSFQIIISSISSGIVLAYEEYRVNTAELVAIFFYGQVSYQINV